MAHRRLAALLIVVALLLPAPTVTLAQSDCLQDTEPNDTPELAQQLGAEVCLEGTLPDGDQDLAIWEVLPAEATTRWTLSVDGLSGILTALKLFRVTSEPGAPTLEVERFHVLEVERRPRDLERGIVEDVLLPPGRYLLGISRSALAGIEGDAAPGYRYRIDSGTPLPPEADVEPNDDRAAASAIGEVGSVSGNLEGSTDYYRWPVGESGERLAIEFQVPLGEQVAVEILDPDGIVIDTVRGQTSVVSLDLDLPPGDYTIGLSPRAFEPLPYVLTTSRIPLEGDAEPNDETATANPLLAGQPILGRLAGDGDRDRFAVEVPAGGPVLRDVRVIWDTELDRTLCLLDRAGEDVICTRGTEGVSLTELGLPPGRNIFEIRGPESAVDPYLLRLDATSAQSPDFEAEPNDRIEYSTVIDPDLDMRGRAGSDDSDIYRLRAEDEAQLWQVDLRGDPGSRLEWIEASGRTLERGQTGNDDTAARLTDLYLVPGDHWFRVTNSASDYALELTPLGPPLPDGEREPNSETVRAERYRIGWQRTGRLAVTSDVDFYRFTLAAAQHIALQLDQPADARTRFILHSGREVVTAMAGQPAGQQLRYDLWLLPGDYLVELRPEQVSAGRYTLSSERLDPFELAVDQEPNDGRIWAGVVPASLEWQGDAVDTNDEDWYRLPRLTSTQPLRISLDDPSANIRFMTPEGQLSLDREGDGVFSVSDVPLDLPLHVVISADGPYFARLTGGGLQPQAGATEPLPVEVVWDLGDDVFAAYWPQWQRATGTVRLSNTGPDDLDLELETSTSHFLWQMRPSTHRVQLRAGEARSIPMEIEVGADAWADEPVQLGVRVASADGAATSATTELSARADATPVSPALGWHVPAALLGGVNVAGSGLLAVPGGTVSADFEPRLYDGVTPLDSGFGYPSNELPIELTVDLAGDEAVLINGIVLNPQAQSGRLSEVPRDFELLLSVDGSEWRPALSGRLSPLPLDQGFVLDEPFAATHAMLRILSVHSDRAGRVALGEWKVIASPGVAAPGGPLDIADPLLGGHMVRLIPASTDRSLGQAILDEDPAREFIYTDGPEAFELVIGFHEGRAAQITALEWVDPTGSKPDERLGGVRVSTSRGGPFGPWEVIGDWDLRRSADGTVAPLVPTAPTWARYLRFEGQTPDARAVELPASLRVRERPSDEEYRSIIGEWGYTSAAGPYEWLAVGGREAVLPASADTPDRLEEASLLLPGTVVSDRVEIDVDEDWYSIDVPPGDNTVELVVSGQPAVRTSLELFDALGQQRPLAFSAQADGSVRYQAAVEPGVRYGLRVHQPPFSAVFSFDTSSSMGPFRDIVAQGMRSFATDVQPGREAVLVVPFEEAPLLPDWEDDTYVLQDAVNREGFDGGSSGAEAGLISAATLLEERVGARAILLVTDAETSTYQESARLWEQLGRVRPIIFSVHVGAATRPAEARHLMQDWAASGAGHYVYPTTHGEMDRAFDRMATWLRRPAGYDLSFTTLQLGPSTLGVRAPVEGSKVPLAPGVGVEIILDTSGSMRKKIDGKRRIDIAKASLRSLIDESLGEDVPVAIRTFGGRGSGRKANCGTTLTLPLGPLDRAAALRAVDGVKARKKTSTPIAAALAAVPADLASVGGLRSVVLITDGAATCDGDPAATIATLREAGVDIKLDIVGFALDDEAIKAEMVTWADAGNGSYFDAAGADELGASLARALSAPFLAYGPDGQVYEGGSVGDTPITIDPGTYRVEVLTDPVVEFDEVVVAAGGSVMLELPAD